MPAYSKAEQLKGHQKPKDKPKIVPKRYPVKKKARKHYTGEKNYKPSLNQRKKFSDAVKREACERFDWKCGNCGSPHLADPHHIRFRSDGGKGVVTNCLPICRPCHILIHQDAELAMKWKEWAKEKYGFDYWMDKWDKESPKYELYRDEEDD